jgi:CRISPR-associated exonuclease Cas4
MAVPDATDPIPISALQHFAYCPRQCALIHVDREWADNLHTQQGQRVHERVSEPAPEQVAGVRIERAVPLWSERLGLIGVADVVEFHHPDGSLFPVEYKKGPRRPGRHDDIQLCAQALCLEEMFGRAVPRGAIFHASSRRRREVTLTPELRAAVEATVAAVRQLLESRRLPPPVNDQRCDHCSLKARCVPAVAIERRADWLFRPLTAES